MKDLKAIVRKYALQNAVFYGGKCNPGAVIGKVMAEKPELRPRSDEVKKAAAAAAKEVNTLSPEEQKQELASIDEKMLVKEDKKQEDLPPLRNAVEGKVVTRFAPSPTGPMNLGQFLRACMLSYFYARKYKGTFFLRIEDTDADKISKECEEWIKEDLDACGVERDAEYRQSDRMKTYYKYADKLVDEGKAYVCVCPAEKFMELKKEMIDCPCRAAKDHEKRWKKMTGGGYGEGGAVLRFMTDMAHPNPVLRDPPLFRINSALHPSQGTKYKCWPLYNFACAVDDHCLRVSHVFRGKEHEHNTAVQALIYGSFGWKQPETVNFGMIYMPGEKLHTRDIKEKIARGEISDWDDPRLHTIRAFLRRGFRPEALKAYAKDCSLTKTDIRINMDSLETHNRRLIDPKADRYMTVLEPEAIIVEGLKKKDAHLIVHPNFPERGKRNVAVEPSSMWISGQDFMQLRGRTIRLKELGNVKLGKNAVYEGNEIVQDMPKIQWVSVPHIKVKVLMPDGSAREGLGEPAMGQLKAGSIIQMERTGFARVDKVEDGMVTLVFAHK